MKEFEIDEEDRCPKGGGHELELAGLVTERKTMRVLETLRCKKCGYLSEAWYANISEVPDYV
jgi:predicted nucleic-acid-binding Zn-ribbon protein